MTFFILVHSFNANNLIKVRLGSCQTYTKAQQKKDFFFVHFLAGRNKVILNKKKEKKFPLHFLFQSVFQSLCILKIFLSKREQGRKKRFYSYLKRKIAIEAKGKNTLFFMTKITNYENGKFNFFRKKKLHSR